MQSEAQVKLTKAMKEYNRERAKLHILQTRDKHVDVEKLLKKKADELKLFELKEIVFEEKQRRSEAVDRETRKIKFRTR